MNSCAASTARPPSLPTGPRQPCTSPALICLEASRTITAFFSPEFARYHHRYNPIARSLLDMILSLMAGIQRPSQQIHLLLQLLRGQSLAQPAPAKMAGHPILTPTAWTRCWNTSPAVPLLWPTSDPAVAVSSGAVRLSYLHALAADEVTPTVMQSSDLSQWTPASVEPDSAAAGADGKEQITVRLTDPPADRFFLKIHWQLRP